MTNADDFCQYARLGQTIKIQKCLQSHSIDVDALNLYGETALSTATYHNQILCVEYLLANKANPKLRLPAGHTTIHIACRLANIPILHMLLSLKKDENCANLEEQRQREDKHLYECLKIKDYSNLTPIHWAATQESVVKRQKIFAYLDKRMPGILESRYDLNWFQSWAKIHPWVIDPKPSAPTKSFLSRTDESSEMTSLDITPKTSNNDYERTPRVPLTLPKTQEILPTTPISSCKVTVTSIYHIPKQSTSDRFTYRAHRVHIQPTIDFPPPPPLSELDEVEQQDTYEDLNTRPSHNLLSNIVPSIDEHSQQIAPSVGFDPSNESRQISETTLYSNTDPFVQNDSDSISSNDYEINQIDYLCKSTSTINIASGDTKTFYTL